MGEDASDAQKRGKYTSSLAVERAADILLTLGSQPSATLSELAAAIGASGGATHRICTALVYKGLIGQDPASDRYSLSWSSLALARARGSNLDIRHVALPAMTELRDKTGETVTLNVRREDQLVCIEQVDSRAELRWVGEVGRVEVLYAGAAGKMLLAGLSDEQLDVYLARTALVSLTAETVVAPQQLKAQIVSARTTDIAVGRGERAAGIVGLAAPVRDSSGRQVAVISLGAPASRMEGAAFETCKQLLLAATQAISTELGYRRPATNL